MRRLLHISERKVKHPQFGELGNKVHKLIRVIKSQNNDTTQSSLQLCCPTYQVHRAIGFGNGTICPYHCKCEINRCENLHIGNQGYYSVAVNWKTCTHTCSSCFKTPLYCFMCFMRQAPKHDACCQCQYHLGPDLMNKEPQKIFQQFFYHNSNRRQNLNQADGPNVPSIDLLICCGGHCPAKHSKTSATLTLLCILK